MCSDVPLGVSPSDWAMRHTVPSEEKSLESCAETPRGITCSPLTEHASVDTARTLAGQADLCEDCVGRQRPWDSPWGAVCALRVQRGSGGVDDSKAAAARPGDHQLAWPRARVGRPGLEDDLAVAVEQRQVAVLQRSSTR